MKAPAVFGIIVRTIGLLLALHGLSDLQSFVALASGFDNADAARGALLLGFVLEVGLGLGLLFGAGTVVRLSYRQGARTTAHEPGVGPGRQRSGRTAKPAPPDF